MQTKRVHVSIAGLGVGMLTDSAKAMAPLSPLNHMAKIMLCGIFLDLHTHRGKKEATRRC